MDQIDSLSPWWRRSVVVVVLTCFCVLGLVSRRTYLFAPPIPKAAVDPSGEVVYTAADVAAGQEIFLKHGLMENGTIWGHGAYLGPDFSALYLHRLALEARTTIVRRRGAITYAALRPEERGIVRTDVARLLKENRYDPQTGTLRLTEVEVDSFRTQLAQWTDYFRDPATNGGLPRDYISDPAQIRQLAAFFAWAAWASVVDRPGSDHSYTNNFPYDPDAGNVPTSGAILWSALSLIMLLGATAAILFAFGRFDFLGWRGTSEHVHPHMLGAATASQQATVKFFVIVSLLLLAQVLVGGGVEHYRADPSSFYGIDISWLFPSQLLRTWHLQLAILWVATAFVAGGLFLAPTVGATEPAHQAAWVHLAFWALVVVAGGSLVGEWFGMHEMMGKVWMWFGNQGWEYLDLGRAWQLMLAVGLLLWLWLIWRGIRPALKDAERGELSSLFLCSATAIPVFYVPAFFYRVDTNYAVVDLWRFWIIHLWVEGFLELFVTVAVALIFYHLAMVKRATAVRVIYLDALLYLGSGIIGTAHHWYFTGQPEVTMALGAMFSAMEVVPLTLLTLDAWDFVKLTRRQCGLCGESITVPHRWTFYFLMAVGFWNFVGAGVFGFLINLPIVSYFEVGTLLTPNHGHAAFMGVFGMLAVALMVFAYRQVLSGEAWARLEKYVRVSFWGLNLGLALMLAANLFPGGVVQLRDVLHHGYWHARSMLFRDEPLMRAIEWARMPGDLVFILLGVLPLVIASIKTYLALWRAPTDVQAGERAAA
ncbi:MAG TPA: cbb3-type cytochrome c oxidase subunit I [Candidatus Binataceae bacterium]|nr:cbb3-type cytochrome c oxidase subunit I [Candidatus Binataceae bacterium]